MEIKKILARIFISKKVAVALIALAVAVASAAGFDIPPEKLDMLFNLIKWVAGSFFIGQGAADGLSKGRTSAARDIYD